MILCTFVTSKKVKKQSNIAGHRKESRPQTTTQVISRSLAFGRRQQNHIYNPRFLFLEILKHIVNLLYKLRHIFLSITKLYVKNHIILLGHQNNQGFFYLKCTARLSASKFE